MAALEVIALDTSVPQLMAPQAGDTYTFPRAVEMPLGTANGVLYLNGSKVVTSGSALTFDGTGLFVFNTTNGGTFSFKNTTNTAGFDVGLLGGSGDNTGYIYNRSSGGIVFAANNAEQMRLTSTGLGIGTSSPSFKVDARGSSGTGISFIETSSGNSNRVQLGTGSGFGFINADAGAGTIALALQVSGSTKATLDSSGNLGLGVTPSGWAASWKVLEGQGGFIGANSTDGIVVSNNAYSNGTNWIYKNTKAASQYFQLSGAHQWFNAPSGTAGNAISFTQAMTLDASGRLLIGQTAEKTQEVVRIASSGQSSLLLDNTGKTNGAFVGVFNDAALFGVNRNPSTGVFYNTSNYAAEIVAVGSSSTSYIAFGTATAANTAPTERVRIKSTGQLRFVPLGADPAGAESGDVYYNSGTNKLRLYDGSTWVDLN